jgi:NTP pyrophosphatase (non-canonical NTP hydrolase)
MNDKDTTIAHLKEIVKRFCEERDWDQYHNAKDLSIGIITEASELLEHFRFKSNDEIAAMFKNPEKSREINEEMSDVLYFLIRLSQRYDIDLADSFGKKMEKNTRKYPIEKSKGSNKKYTEL